MILKIYNDVEILIDEEDVERILKVLRKNCMWHASKSGQVHGRCNTKSGYSKKYLLSRVVMNCYNGALDVDHINHNQLDFRKENLRVCTHQENCFNTKPKVGATLLAGVYYKKDRNKYAARIRTKHGRISLGSFKTAEEANTAYFQAVMKYHGDFAYKTIKV